MTNVIRLAVVTILIVGYCMAAICSVGVNDQRLLGIIGTDLKYCAIATYNPGPQPCQDCNHIGLFNYTVQIPYEEDGIIKYFYMPVTITVYTRCSLPLANMACYALPFPAGSTPTCETISAALSCGTGVAYSDPYCGAAVQASVYNLPLFPAYSCSSTARAVAPGANATGIDCSNIVPTWY